VKDVDRHLFFDKVKSFGIDNDSCLYEIPKNDLVDDMKLWPPVTFHDVCTYLIETPGDFTEEIMTLFCANNMKSKHHITPVCLGSHSQEPSGDRNWDGLHHRRTQDFTIKGVHRSRCGGMAAGLGDISPQKLKKNVKSVYNF